MLELQCVWISIKLVENYYYVYGIGTCTNTNTRTHTHTHTHTHAHTRVCTDTHEHTNIHTWKDMYVCSFIDICTNMAFFTHTHTRDKYNSWSSAIFRSFMSCDRPHGHVTHTQADMHLVRNRTVSHVNTLCSTSESELAR